MKNVNFSMQIPFLRRAVLKTVLFSGQFLQCCLKMKHQAFLTSLIILFTHQKRAKPRLSWCASDFQNIRPSFTIIRYRPRSVLLRKPIYLWRQALMRGVAIRLETSVLGKVYVRLLCSNIAASLRAALVYALVETT